MKHKNTSIAPIIENSPSSQKALFIGSIASKATKGFVHYLKGHSIDVFQIANIPKSLYSYQFVFFQDPNDLDLLKDLISKMAPHMRVLIICTKKTIYEKISKKIISQKFKNISVIKIDPEHVGEEIYERWIYQLISPRAEKVYDFAPFYTEPKITKVKNPIRFHLSKKGFVLLMILLVFIWSSLFLPTFFLSLFSLRNFVKSDDSQKKQYYLQMADYYQSKTHQLFSFSKPVLSLFFLSLPFDNFIDFHSKTITSLKRSSRLAKNSQEFVAAITTNPNKSIAENKLTSIEDDLIELDKELAHLSQNPTLNLPIYRDYKKNLDELSQLSPLFPPMVAQLRQLLTSKSDKNIVVFFYNNMELRPGGGFIGSFFTITVSDWKLRNTRVYDVYEADGRLTTSVEPPQFISKYLAQPYWYLRDSNTSPDFEQNVKTASRFLQEEIDLSSPSLAFALTTSAIEKALLAIGPVYLPQYKTTITSENFYLTTQTEIESKFFPGSTNKRDFLQALLSMISLKLSSISPEKMISTIKNILEEKQVVMFSDSPQLASIISNKGWGGKLIIPQCLSSKTNCVVGYIFPIEANVGVNKANFFIKRGLSIEIDMKPDGRLSQKVKYQIKNDSPSNQYPGGVYKNWLQFYLPKKSLLSEINLNNKSVDYESLESDYFRQLGVYLEIPPNEKSSITFDSYTINQVGDFIHLEYIIQKQIGVAPYEAKLQFSIPPGYEVVGKNFSGLVKDRRVLYNTPINKDRLLVIDLKKQK